MGQTPRAPPTIAWRWVCPGCCTLVREGSQHPGVGGGQGLLRALGKLEGWVMTSQLEVFYTWYDTINTAPGTGLDHL